MNSRQRRKRRRANDRAAASFKRTMFGILQRAESRAASASVEELDAMRGLLVPNEAASFLRGLKFPLSPEVGMLWYDPSTGIERRWNGSTWVCTECTTAPDCKITLEIREC